MVDDRATDSIAQIPGDRRLATIAFIFREVLIHEKENSQIMHVRSMRVFCLTETTWLELSTSLIFRTIFTHTCHLAIPDGNA